MRIDNPDGRLMRLGTEQSIFHHALLLLQMPVELPDCRRGRHGPPSVCQRNVPLQQGEKAVLDLMPSPLILGLLLAPDQLL
jgi:hypothetical protein